MPIRIDATSWAKRVLLRLSFLEDDRWFADFESRFAAHLKYPFAQCEFSLLCKPRRMTPKPVSTLRFNFESRKWQMLIYNGNDYAVKKLVFSAESPAILLADLADRWKIENLGSFRLEVAGTTQMQLL